MYNMYIECIMVDIGNLHLSRQCQTGTPKSGDHWKQRGEELGESFRTSGEQLFVGRQKKQHQPDV